MVAASQWLVIMAKPSLEEGQVSDNSTSLHFLFILSFFFLHLGNCCYLFQPKEMKKAWLWCIFVHNKTSAYLAYTTVYLKVQKSAIFLG